jgi:hypothetical protein
MKWTDDTNIGNAQFCEACYKGWVGYISIICLNEIIQTSVERYIRQRLMRILKEEEEDLAF